MIVLKTTDVLKVTRSSAADIHASVHFCGTDADDQDVAEATYTSAATGTLVSSPASGRTLIKSAFFCNQHASTANTIKIIRNNGSTDRVLVQATLQAGDTLAYADGRWYILGAAGIRMLPFAMSGDGTLDAMGALTLAAASITGKSADDIALGDYISFYDASGADLNKVLIDYLLGFTIDVPGFRLSGTSGDPNPATDPGSGLTSVYYEPYTHNRIRLCDGTRWVQYNLSAALSCLLSDTTKSPAAVANGSNYDLFVWDDAGTVRLSRGPAWSSNTARGTGAGTTELERKDGVWVNKQVITNGPAAQRGRYVGSIRGTAANQTTDSAAKRFIWNAYNQVPRKLFYGENDADGAADSVTSFTSTTNWAQIGSFQVEVLTGLDGITVDLQAHGLFQHSVGGGSGYLGIGVGSVTNVVNVIQWLQVSGASSFSQTNTLNDLKTAGYQIYYMSWLLAVAGTGTMYTNSVAGNESVSGDYYLAWMKGFLNA